MRHEGHKGLKDNLWAEDKLRGVETESNSTVFLSGVGTDSYGLYKNKREATISHDLCSDTE